VGAHCGAGRPGPFIWRQRAAAAAPRRAAGHAQRAAGHRRCFAAARWRRHLRASALATGRAAANPPLLPPPPTRRARAAVAAAAAAASHHPLASDTASSPSAPLPPHGAACEECFLTPQNLQHLPRTPRAQVFQVFACPISLDRNSASFLITTSGPT
jgi:hypothetical protein